MIFEKPVAELIKTRSSWRKYLTGDLSPQLKENISQWISKQRTGPLQSTVRFQLIEKGNSGNNDRVKLGTYGFISGARFFIAGALKPGDGCFEDYGYLLEKIILFLTDLELGTCWLGGTFKKEDFARPLNLGQNEIIPAVTPVGHPSARRGLKDRLIRKSAGSKNRKPWEELFFTGDFSHPLNEEQAGAYRLPLEMVRLGPSASNKQPWRILYREGVFHFFLARTKNYDNMFKDVDIQRMDIGIAMCHFELTAREADLDGSWKSNDIRDLPEDFEYKVSWVPNK